MHACWNVSNKVNMVNFHTMIYDAKKLQYCLTKVKFKGL